MKESLLYTLPQWFIFAAIIVVVYGWIEDKKAFRIIGGAIFIVLGIFSLYVITGDSFAPGQFLTPSEIADSELGETQTTEIAPLAGLLAAYLGFVVSAVLAIPAIYLDIKNKKYYRHFFVLAGLVALYGFFVIVGVLKNL